MGSFGAPEIMLILLVLVLLFGAKKLPELARGSGRALRIFKAETKGLIDDDDDTKTEAQRQIDSQRQADVQRQMDAQRAESQRIESQRIESQRIDSQRVDDPSYDDGRSTPPLPRNDTDR